MEQMRIHSSIAPFLDEEGFLSRECPSPACTRQFRAHNEGTPEQASYYCPYCGHSAANEEWWTADQARFQEERIGLASELLGGALFDKVKGPGI